MPGQGLVLYREKTRAPWPLHAIFAGALATVVGSAVVAGQLASLLFSAPVLARSKGVFDPPSKKCP